MISATLALCVCLTRDKGASSLPTWMWGFTVDSVASPGPIVESLSNLPTRPVTRIVFDRGVTPANYKPAVDQIHKVSWVMGEPIDSVMTKSLTLSEYRERMTSFLDGLRGSVDLWEVGNEVNGDWGGASADVAEKVTAGFREAKKRRVKTALTLFWSDFYVNTDRDLVAWSTKYLNRDVKRGVDYVFVSFYPQSADGPHPNWEAVFSGLGKVFPKAKLGFGELGLADAHFNVSTDPVQKAILARRYYRRHPAFGDRFVGGFFWWTFLQDSVPHGTGMWPIFRNAMAGRDQTEPE